MVNDTVTESEGPPTNSTVDKELVGVRKEKPIVVDIDAIHDVEDAPPSAVAAARSIADTDKTGPVSAPPLSEVEGERVETTSGVSHVSQPEVQDTDTVVEDPLPSKQAPPTPPAKSPQLQLARDSIEVYQPRPATPSTPAKANGHDELRPQTPSSAHSSSSASSHKRSITISKGYTVSVVLISSALEIILASREAKRSTPLRESAHNALEMIRVGQGGDRPREIFEPLRLACETRSEKLMIASLDCISKLISYSFFAEPSSAQALPSPPPSPVLQGRRSIAGTSQSSLPQPSLVDLVVHTITTCHNDTSPETVSLQVVKALLSLILSPTIYVHHSSLLKAVRTVYNVFLLSTDLVNQMVAQGGLTQMVHHIFSRCRTLDGATLRSHVSSDTFASIPAPGSPKIDIQNPSFVLSGNPAENLTAEALPLESAVDMPLHPGVPTLPSSIHDPDVPQGTTSPTP
jgi:brefeldin A-inhibited guanine nucleotide-exchange protein